MHHFPRISVGLALLFCVPMWDFVSAMDSASFQSLLSASNG